MREVSEEPKDATANRGCDVLATQVLSLFMEYGFVEPSLAEPTLSFLELVD